MRDKSTEDERLKHADYMREWYRRKRGGESIKGETFTCDICQTTQAKTGHSQRWCAACKPEGMRRYKTAKRLNAGHEPLGCSKPCKHCGVSVIKQHRRQFYCTTCSELSAKSALPDARKVQVEYQKARNKLRRRTIPSVAIAGRISAQIGHALRGRKAGRKWESIVGYTVEELMAHIERQFLKGMSWGNRSEWHLDHVVPLTSFIFTGPDDPEVRRAWALPNLRPLWAGDNIRKSGRRTHLL